MKNFSSPTQRTGELGEDIAVRFLEGKGFAVIERNHTRKWGEIDIIALKLGVTHIVEVKSVTLTAIPDVSCENKLALNEIALDPMDHMDRRKQERLSRTIEIYLLEYNVFEWQFDVVCVYVHQNSKKAWVKIFENIIL